MKPLFTLFVLFNFLNLKAQESVLFKQKYLPEKTYKSSTKISTNFTMNIDGEKEAVEELGEAQNQFPMKISSEIDIEITNKTGSKEDGKIPFIITYDKLQSKNVINGEETTAPNPFENTQIKGYYTDGIVAHIDEIIGFQGDEKLKNMLINMFENLSQNIKFPDYPLKIGEQFNQHIPMTVPVPEVGNFDLDMNYIYTLIDIKNNFGYFDLEIQFTMNTQLKDKEMTMNGFGNGKIQFDMTNSMMSLMNSNINVKMDFEFSPEIKLNLVADSQTEFISKVEK